MPAAESGTLISALIFPFFSVLSTAFHVSDSDVAFLLDFVNRSGCSNGCAHKMSLIFRFLHLVV